MRRPAPDLEYLIAYFHGASRAATAIDDQLRRIEGPEGRSTAVPRALRDAAERNRSALEATRSIGRRADMEIERKFLLAGDPDDAAVVSRKAIKQGYIGVTPDESEVRIRAIDESFRLTIKSGAGEVREEHEVEIGAALFEELWPLTEGRRVEKERLCIPYGGLTIELDVYGAALSGLRVAEVEFDSVEDARRFEPPSWFGTEVTGDPAYRNQSLALRDAAPVPSPDPR
jgi:CYTH domain-containing protein